MANLTVRNVPDEVHRAFRLRATAHERSTEAEIRDMLEGAVKPAQRIRMGDALAKIGRSIGLTDAEAEGINSLRDKTEPRRTDTF